MNTQKLVKRAAVLMLAAGLAAQGWAKDQVQKPPAGSTADLTPEQITAGQTIIAESCNGCHARKKPLTAGLLQKISPAKMTGHFQKQARLKKDQIRLLVQYLTAVGAGKAELPKPAEASAKKKGSSKPQREE